jgi:hypothetical protein
MRQHLQQQQQQQALQAQRTNPQPSPSPMQPPTIPGMPASTPAPGVQGAGPGGVNPQQLQQIFNHYGQNGVRMFQTLQNPNLPFIQHMIKLVPNFMGLPLQVQMGHMARVQVSFVIAPTSKAPALQYNRKKWLLLSSNNSSSSNNLCQGCH